MKTVQDGLIAHIESGALGFERVKEYAGEVVAAAKNPSVLTGLLPLALVIYLDGNRRHMHGTYRLDVLVWGRTQALLMQEDSQDTLALAESLVRWLEDQFTFQHGGRRYTINLDTGVDTNTLLVGGAYTIIKVGLEVKEL